MVPVTVSGFRTMVMLGKSTKKILTISFSYVLGRRITITIFKKFIIIAFDNVFGDNGAVVSDVYIASNQNRIGCMAILIGGSIVDIGIIGERIHDEICYIDKE